jgi:outer membrane cobalamin receptor
MSAASSIIRSSHLTADNNRLRFPLPLFLAPALVLILACLCLTAVGQERRGERPSPPAMKPDSTKVDSLPPVRKDSLEHYRLPGGIGSLPKESPALSRITRNDLEWTDYRFMGELIERINGAVMYGQYGAGQYDQLSFHGADWRGVAVLSNGRPLNDPATGIYNLHQYSVEEAEEMEVVGGPAGFLYGLNGAGAAVNLVQKNYRSGTPFSRLRYAENGNNYQFSDGNVSQNLSRRTNLSLGFQHVNTDGRFENSYHDSWILRGKARYSLSTTSLLLLSERFLFAETGLNGGVDLTEAETGLAFVPQQATVVNADSYEKITRHDLDLSFIAQPFADSTELSQITLYYSNNLREYRDEENRTSPNGIVVRTDHRSSWMGLRAQQQLTLRGQTLAIGGSAELRQIEASPTLGRHRDVVTSLWANSVTSLLTPLRLSLYARLDGYLGDSYTGVGMEMQYRVSSALLLFAGGSVSRRLPTYTELFWTDSTVIRPLPITAELHRHIEAGACFDPGTTLSFHLTVFRRKVEDPIIFSASSASRVFPGILIRQEPERAYRGLDFSTICRIGFVFVEGKAEYLLQEDSTGALSSGRPKLTAQGGVYFWDSLLHDKLELKAGFRAMYASRSTGPMFNPEVPAYVEQLSPTGAWSRVDFVALAHIGDAQIHFSWENLTNVKYYGTPYYPGFDRTIRFGIAWEFQN